MIEDAARIVKEGYDVIADVYLERFGVSAVRTKWLNRLTAALPEQGRVLDMGCGAGIPVARTLAALGYSIVGIDSSSEQIARAAHNVPSGQFIVADMTKVDFDENSFDGVCAFYSITHVPPEQQSALIASIGRWLKPGGTFIASFGTGSPHEWKGAWLGTTMYFGHSGEEEIRRDLSDAGFAIHRWSVEQQDNEDVAFMWIEAIWQ